MSIQDLRDVKIITAMITPFKEDGSINFEVLPELIEHLLSHHTEGILLAGTTAESPTLTHEEELELFGAVQKIVNGRVPLIAGIGTNDTRDSIEFAKEVAAFGGFAAGLVSCLTTTNPLKRECISTSRPLQMLLIYQSLSTIFQGVLWSK